MQRSQGQNQSVLLFDAGYCQPYVVQYRLLSNVFKFTLAPLYGTVRLGSSPEFIFCWCKVDISAAHVLIIQVCVKGALGRSVTASSHVCLSSPRFMLDVYGLHDSKRDYMNVAQVRRAIELIG